MADDITDKIVEEHGQDNPPDNGPQLKYRTDNGVPSQFYVNGKYVTATPEEAAKLVGTTPKEGPGAEDARDFETKARIAAGLKPEDKLPPAYEVMVRARSAGYGWDEINAKMLQARQAALEAGYSNDEFNAKMLGYSPRQIDHTFLTASGKPSPLPTPINMPAEQAAALRGWATKWFGPHDLFREAGLETPGQVGEVSAGSILSHVGWSLWDFAKTFPGAVVNGLGATAEMMDGKQRNPYEWASLAYEAAGFWLLALPGEAAVRKLGFNDFVDGAVQLKEKFGVDPQVGLPALGEHYTVTNEHPLDAVARIQSPLELEQAPTRQAAKIPVDKITQGAEEVAATDKIIPPKDEAKPMPVKPQQFEGSPELGVEHYIQPEELFQHDPEIASGIIHDWLAMWTPGSLAPNAGEAISAMLAKSTVEAQKSIMAIQRFGRVVGELSTEERYKYIDAIETGNLKDYEGTPLGELGAQLRKELDHWYNVIKENGGELGYIQDYLPHMYADPIGANKWLRTRSQLAGGKAFTKERVFGTYEEARAAGLQMASDNPIHISAVALNQMSRYAAALRVVKEFRDNNIITEIKPKEAAPDRFVPISGKLGVTEFGTLYAPEDVARLINNLTDKGLAQYPLYRLLRGLSNTQIQLQLGFSGFHAMFVMRDVMTSAMAEGVKAISRGLMNKPSLESIAEIPRGLMQLAASPLAPFKGYAQGRAIIKQALGLKQYTGMVPAITDAYLEGGGRLGMTTDYRGTAYGDMLQALKGTFMPSTGYATVGQELADMWRNARNIRTFGYDIPGSNVAKFAFQLAARTVETASAPIMAHLVPTMKAGVFSMAMREAMRVAPEMGLLEMRHVANILNKSIDNRLGEMVYDNRFWNRTLKDVLHLSVRALGWNAGDIAEIPGGVLDLATGKTESLDGTRQLTTRASYVVGVTVNAIITGAIIGYMTGNPPQSLQDYIFPQTPWGRISLPGYEKDIYNWMTKPGDTAANKLNPLIANVREMMTNRDWYGAAIADYEHEDTFTNIKDLAHWFAGQYMPISFRQQFAPSPEQQQIPPELRWLGLNPAPFDVRNPGQAEQYRERELKQALRKREKERARSGQ